MIEKIFEWILRAIGWILLIALGAFIVLVAGESIVPGLGAGLLIYSGHLIGVGLVCWVLVGLCRYQFGVQHYEKCHFCEGTGCEVREHKAVPGSNLLQTTFIPGCRACNGNRGSYETETYTLREAFFGKRESTDDLSPRTRRSSGE